MSAPSPSRDARARVPRSRAAAGRYAALTRSRTPDDPELIAAHTEVKTAKLAAYIEELVNSAPPLTTAQRDQLALLLRDPGATSTRPSAVRHVATPPVAR